MLNNLILNKNPVKIKRALVSVFDKTGLVDLAKALNKLGVEILSTGGTAAALNSANIPVTDVSSYTRFPEIMDGRVKTINPLIVGGILGLRDKHNKDVVDNKIKWIDLVVCNLYPFSEVIKREDCDFTLAMEYVDVGGPTMIRSAAKNVGWSCVVVDSADYLSIIEELKSGVISFQTRKQLSVKAFGHTAQYDAIIHKHLLDEKFPDKLTTTYEKHSVLRYGENPHQAASAFKIINDQSANILNAKIHQGKALSYNNIMDADAALSCIKEFDKTACVIVKHSSPCGVAEGENLLEVYRNAFDADSLSAFGGIIALNQNCSADLANEINKVFVEIVLAPSFDREALKVFSNKKNLRILETGDINKRKDKLEIRNLDGGVLVQDVDTSSLTMDALEVVTEISPTDSDFNNMFFGWKVLKHIKSNAILLVKDNITIGIGGGQVSRVDSVDIAINKSGDKISESILCSDAFIPFRDSIDRISKTGVKAIIQPGGSIRDNEIISACNEHGISMVFTGKRCFKH